MLFRSTDNSWKFSSGPILKSSFYNGEIYDARLENNGWNEIGFKDDNWNNVSVDYKEERNIIAPLSKPVRRIMEIKPINIIITSEGDTVFDFGQNMVGWCRLKVNNCPPGTRITLKHAEILDKNGNFYTDNLRSARQRNIYICKGGPNSEIYEPHFTFQGFRYVSISGYPFEVTKEILTGVVIHSDLKITGLFSCNNLLINQLQHNIVWSQRGNFLDVPTDCPQRNERLGWTGDVQVFTPTACFNMDCFGFYNKWLKDLAADQHDDGNVPWIIPDLTGRGGAAGWADAAVIVPWIVYRYYGDKRILEEQYTSMRAWVEYVHRQAGEDYLWKPEGTQFGDWLAFSTNRSDYPGATTAKDLVATAYYYHSVDILQKTTEIIGKEKDKLKYQSLLEKIKEAFNKEYVTPNGRLTSNTQTSYVLPLSFGLIDGEAEVKAAERLAQDVNHFGHLTTGFLGTPEICDVLTSYGYLDEAYMLLYREQYPSWLYPVKQGATTIWERWDGIKPDGTLQDPSMNSFNHYAYGAIGKWLYKIVGGIDLDPEEPGFKEFIIKPYPYSSLNDVQTSFESLYGNIVSEWSIKNDRITLRVNIPANTRAKIYIPSTGKALIVNNEISESYIIKNEIGLEYHFLYLERGSGSYIFEAPFFD